MPPPEHAPPVASEKQIPKQIFVAHGKNKKPLEQLEKILNKFKVTYKVAISEPHGGRPISGKVAELMKNCTLGIFIFTADEETLEHSATESPEGASTLKHQHVFDISRRLMSGARFGFALNG